MKINTIITTAIFLSFSVFADPVFEFANKHSQPVWITVQEFVANDPALVKRHARDQNKDAWLYYGEDVLRSKKVEPGQRVTAAISNINNEVRLLMNFEGNVGPNNHTNNYLFSTGKTLFLTFNPSKSPNKCAGYLYPQTGTFLGLSGKTESGYSLKNNISAQDISVIICATVGK